jgi:Xaa-Pro aminopeptidase
MLTRAAQACWTRSRGFTISVGASTYWLRYLIFKSWVLRFVSIPYNPVFFSYAVVTPTTATLYIDSAKISDEVRFHLGDSVTIRPYDAIQEDVKLLKETLSTDPVASEDSSAPKAKVRFLISTKTSWALSEALGGEEKVEEIRSLIADAKAVKNETELEGMRACHIRDGAALIEYFAWLEEELVVKGTKLDEVEAADKLEKIRSFVLHCPNSSHIANGCQKAQAFCGPLV